MKMLVSVLVVLVPLATACGPLPPPAQPEPPVDLAEFAGTAVRSPAARLSPAEDLEIWRGLRVAAPERCSPYRSSDYAVSAAWPLPRLSRADGSFFELLTCQPFAGPGDSAIARVVAAEAGHDAGLCTRSPADREAFATDADNWFYGDRVVLALARRGRGADRWLPTRNVCWYAQTELLVRQRYDLTVSPAEAAALEEVFAGCGPSLRPPTCDAPRSFAP